MVSKDNRLDWIEENSNVTAYNKDKQILGYLTYERTGRFKHWCWYQFQDIRMSPGCLQEVRDKQKELFSRTNGKHRSGGEE